MDGKASDPETGIVTIESLRKYIQEQMRLEGSQTPIYAVAEASSIETIKIAISENQFNKKLSALIGEINTALQERPKDSKFVDIQALNDAAKKLSDLGILTPTNKEITTLKQRINDELHLYEQPLMEWLNNNSQVARRKINEVSTGLYDDILYELVGELSYEEFRKIGGVSLKYLIYLITEVKKVISV